MVSAVKALSALSGSVLVSVPEVETGASVSVSTRATLETVAASFVTLTVISTVLGVPVEAGDVKGFVNTISDMVNLSYGTVGGEGPVTGGIDIEITDGNIDGVYSESIVCVIANGAGQRAGSRDRCICWR